MIPITFGGGYRPTPWLPPIRISSALYLVRFMDVTSRVCSRAFPGGRTANCVLCRENAWQLRRRHRASPLDCTTHWTSLTLSLPNIIGESGCATSIGKRASDRIKRPICQNEIRPSRQVFEKAGAGEGNRTLVFSLEGCCSTIELHPRALRELTRRALALNRPGSAICGKRPPFRQARRSRRAPLNTGRIRAYTEVSTNTMKGGDPVSCSKRCHLAGIAR